ncbi:hypothetical protein RF55_10816 [Lasius niger]|uniref:Uncharacterized protein n=1 Tax=Lasius niger TaxID=67767 RepID=A0A0J7NAA1_LASNI|nr:hypothetical protein RF55_10816 [Lasius niger]
MEESIDVTNDFKSNKRPLGAVDVTDKLQDSQVLVDVVVAAADAAVDFEFDVAAAAVAVAAAAAAAAAAVAAMSAVDDGYDCDYGDDFVAPSTSRISVCKDRAPAEAAPYRSLCAEARSANSD